MKERLLFEDEQSAQPQVAPEVRQKKRFIVRIGDKIHIILISDIVYFSSKEKTTYLFNREGRAFIVDMSLEMLERTLNPQQFFRINRACIANLDYIKMATRHFSGRLRLTIEPAQPEEEFFVSRVRTSDFMRWISQ